MIFFFTAENTAIKNKYFLTSAGETSTEFDAC